MSDLPMPYPPLEERLETIARAAIHVYLAVERGLLPARLLTRFATPELLQSFGPFAPVTAEQRRHRLDVDRVHVQVTSSRHAYVAAVVPRLDGRPGALLLELRHDPVVRRWHVAELTRAEERRLVGGRDREPLPLAERALPDRLDHLYAAIVAELTAAGEAIATLRGEIEQAGDDTAAARGRQRRDAERRTSVLGRDLERWERRAEELTGELAALRDVEDLRDFRAAVLRRDPLVAAGGTHHLEVLLGPVPDDAEDRREWRKAASEVESYRQIWSIRDPDRPLGEPLGEAARAAQVAHRHNAARAVEAYTRDRGAEPHPPEESGIEIERDP